MCTPGKLQQRQRVTSAAWWTACPCSLCLPNCVHLQANNFGHHLTQSLLPALRLFAKSNARLGMILDKIVLSVPGSGTAHGGWAHAWPSHKLLRQVQNASCRSATYSVKANGTFRFHPQLWHTHQGTQAKQYTKTKNHSHLACHCG